MAMALYFDTVNFAPRIKAPVLAAIGFLDTTAPPAGVWIALNQISAPKEVVPLSDGNHTSRTLDKHAAFDPRVKEVLDAVLHGGQFTPAGVPRMGC
jgi:cephalosporin-C deacetylase-like acetyl esterase